MDIINNFLLHCDKGFLLFIIHVHIRDITRARTNHRFNIGGVVRFLDVVDGRLMVVLGDVVLGNESYMRNICHRDVFHSQQIIHNHGMHRAKKMKGDTTVHVQRKTWTKDHSDFDQAGNLIPRS